MTCSTPGTSCTRCGLWRSTVAQPGPAGRSSAAVLLATAPTTPRAIAAPQPGQDAWATESSVPALVRKAQLINPGAMAAGQKAAASPATALAYRELATSTAPTFPQIRSQCE